MLHSLSYLFSTQILSYKICTHSFFSKYYLLHSIIFFYLYSFHSIPLTPTKHNITMHVPNAVFFSTLCATMLSWIVGLHLLHWWILLPLPDFWGLNSYTLCIPTTITCSSFQKTIICAFYPSRMNHGYITYNLEKLVVLLRRSIILLYMCNMLKSSSQ